MMSNPKNDLQKKLTELETLLEWFEQDDIDIEQALEKYEQGAQLAAAVREQLTQIENKIVVLEKRFDQGES